MNFERQALALRGQFQQRVEGASSMLRFRPNNRHAARVKALYEHLQAQLEAFIATPDTAPAAPAEREQEMA